MADDSPTGATSTSETFNIASKLFSVGADLINEVQTHVGSSKVRSLRLTLGGKPIKDFPVSPATAIASLLLVIAAVIISNLRVEVIKDTDGSSGSSARKPIAAKPGGVQ